MATKTLRSWTRWRTPTIRTRCCCLRSSETKASCTRELPRLTLANPHPPPSSIPLTTHNYHSPLTTHNSSLDLPPLPQPRPLPHPRHPTLIPTLALTVTAQAFEMNPDKVRQLERAARIRPATQRFAERLHVHQMGVGNTTAQGRVVKCGGGRGYANTWRAMDASQAPPSADCDIGDAFRLTTMDAFAREKDIKSIMYAKVDVEGGARPCPALPRKHRAREVTKPSGSRCSLHACVQLHAPASHWCPVWVPVSTSLL